MIKQTLSASLVALALGFTLGSTAVFADEPMPISDTQGYPVPISDEPTAADDGCNDTTNATNTRGDGVTTNCPPRTDGDTEIHEPSDEVVTGENIDLEEGEGMDKTEVEVDCVATPDADACAVEEAPLWPMYLSLGALGLVVVVFIVLNLFGGKKQK